MGSPKYRVVIDTNVFIAALRSKKGASFKLLFETPRKKFTQNVSTSLIFEYESVAKRETQNIGLTDEHIDSILDMLCFLSTKCKIFYLWRPVLRDPKDDMILELAIESQSDYIITYNKKDFKGIDKFGIEALTPKEFLMKMGELQK